MAPPPQTPGEQLEFLIQIASELKNFTPPEYEVIAHGACAGLSNMNYIMIDTPVGHVAVFLHEDYLQLANIEVCLSDPDINPAQWIASTFCIIYQDAYVPPNSLDAGAVRRTLELSSFIAYIKAQLNGSNRPN